MNTNRARGAALSLVIAVAGIVGISSPTHAEDRHADHQPCVSAREWHSLYQQTKPALEDRWEVTGLGVRVALPFGLVSQLVMYPRCGYAPEVAWYGITYKRRGKHLWAVWATQCETWKTGTPCLGSEGDRVGSDHSAGSVPDLQHQVVR